MRVWTMSALLGLSLMTVHASWAGPLPELDLQADLESFLTENPTAPGVSVYVRCPPLDLDWSGAAGTVARDDSTPLTPDHVFRIASNTKTYTAAALLRLVERRELRLEDSLSEHLTPARDRLLRSEGYDTDAITVAQVLSHTAGLGDHTEDPRNEESILADPQRVWTADEQIAHLVEWREPVGEPGERYVYSDTGYVLLGTIIEGLTGRSLGPSVRELLDFDGLGLSETWWEYQESPPTPTPPRAHQYFGEIDVTAWNASFDLHGGGGLMSNPEEMATFLRQLLRLRVFEKQATLVDMTSRGTRPYRLGLMVSECDGRLAYGHEGFWNTFAYHVPSLDLTVAGSVLDHEATRGFELLRRIVERIGRHAAEAAP